MKLFVGLGNPGERHARQRHNVGFMAVERIAARHAFGPWRQRFRGLLAEGALDGERIWLLEPQTFMNESGRSIAEATRFMKLPLADVVLFHDELDLAAGKVRVKLGGGVAGHNGLRSADACLGSRDFRRVRIGIGHPGHKDRVLGHVLADFHKAEQVWLEPFLDAIADAAPLLAKDDDAGFMNRVAFLTQPPKPPRSERGEAALN
jgi:PTH1 family peptidyl-tRNA hydrolase